MENKRGGWEKKRRETEREKKYKKRDRRDRGK